MNPSRRNFEDLKRKKHKGRVFKKIVLLVGSFTDMAQSVFFFIIIIITVQSSCTEMLLVSALQLYSRFVLHHHKFKCSHCTVYNMPVFLFKSHAVGFLRLPYEAEGMAIISEVVPL